MARCAMRSRSWTRRSPALRCSRTAGARLDASQIRELMGTVPNAVFERILAAVDANQSAEVLTVANQLLDAGNSPAQLARQCVRYLRNCLIARIAGVAAGWQQPGRPRRGTAADFAR